MADVTFRVIDMDTRNARSRGVCLGRTAETEISLTLPSSLTERCMICPYLLKSWRSHGSMIFGTAAGGYIATPVVMLSFPFSNLDRCCAMSTYLISSDT